MQSEKFTEYKIIAILTDLEANDYFNTHAEIFQMLANMCPLDMRVILLLASRY